MTPIMNTIGEDEHERERKRAVRRSFLLSRTRLEGLATDA